MNNSSFWIYLLIMAGSTYLIRAVPFALLRKKIEHPFIRSFLYYIPYAVLAAMTFPAALYATGSIISAAVGLAAAAVLALRGKGLTLVAAAACVAAFVTQCVVNWLA